MSAEWYRVDSTEAPQGHALARDWHESQFLAYEQADGTWKVRREDTAGSRSEGAVLPEFSDVRLAVNEAVASYKRASNPKNRDRLVRTGVSVAVGTAIGILLGGLPGILAHHSSLTIVGTQIGGALGAAGGALYSGSRDNNPGVNVRKLKNKLLR